MGAIRIVKLGVISNRQVLRLYSWSTLKSKQPFYRSHTLPAWPLRNTADRQAAGGYDDASSLVEDD